MSRIVAMFALFLIFAFPASAAGLVEEDISLPVSFGEGRRAVTLSLEALVVRPDDGKAHPLVVLSHGAPRKAEDRDGMHARAQMSKAREFARRGWVAVAVMRRGYGRSEGEYVESSGKCNDPDYLAAGRISADDIRQTIVAMAKMPYVDASKVISVGQSAGGFATVALTADPPPGLVAAISFAGGRGSAKPDEVCTPDRLVEAFRAFGKTSRIPMLWVYTENDRFFGPRLSRRFHAAFTEAGGRAQFIAAPAFGEDGHLLFSTKGASIWVPYVEQFLAAQTLTQFARPLPPRNDRDISYPRGLSEKGKVAFRDYLDAAGHKAFSLSSTGAYGWKSGRRISDEAVEMAVEICAKYSSRHCYTVMVDDEAVQ
ncbi:MAG: dienelactone hydrolase family protein [Magnetospirillum sp.]|nr:dienelactone hydrolase family protein [Magnetospirillum sp.]